MAKTKFEAPEIPDAPVGTLIAFDRRGEELWRMDDFKVGTDKVPYGVSLGMGASVLLDPATGEVKRTWNPWGVLG